MNKRSFLQIVFGILALVYVLFFVNDSTALSTALKALPIFILLLGVLFSGELNPRIALALIFSMCGDIVSELKLASGLPFKLQICFFACAQFCYILEWSRFWKHKNPQGQVLPSLTPFLLGGYALLLLGNLIGSIMARRQDRKRFIIGAAIFVLSDSLILVRMISGGFPLDNEFVMFSYYLAQYLLVTPYWANCGKS